MDLTLTLKSLAAKCPSTRLLTPRSLPLSPDQQFLVLVLLIVLCLLAWRLEPETPAAGPVLAAEAASPGWRWIGEARAGELEDSPALAGGGPLPARATDVEPAKAQPTRVAALREVVPPRRLPAVAEPVSADASAQPLPAERAGQPAEAPLPRWQPEAGADYAVQLGVYASWQNALRAARELRGRSLRPELVLDDGAKPVLRLVVGHFTSRAQALEAVRSYRRQRHADAWIYSREDRTLSARWAR